MQYMLLAYVDATGPAALESLTADERTARTATYMAYQQALVAAGALVTSGRLQLPSSATTLRRDASANTQVLDGPFAETKEQLAGFFLIDVPDLDVALKWAKDCPVLGHGACEVRPMFVMPT